MRGCRGVAGVVAAFGVTTAVVATIAYFQIFSFLAEFDDEGYCLISLRLFGQGRALYETVFSMGVDQPWPARRRSRC